MHIAGRSSRHPRNMQIACASSEHDVTALSPHSTGLGRTASPFPPETASRRWTIFNLAAAGLIILVSPEPLLGLALGAATTLLAAITGLLAALRRTVALTRSPTLLEILLAWLPGLNALVLASAGLAILAMSGPGDLLRFAGLALFLSQIAVLAAIDPAPALRAEADPS